MGCEAGESNAITSKERKETYSAANLIAQVQNLSLHAFLIQILDTNHLCVPICISSGDAGMFAALFISGNNHGWVGSGKLDQILLHPRTDSTAATIEVAITNDQLFQLTNTSERHGMIGRGRECR